MLTENLLYTDDLHNFQMIDNYIYMYHLDKYIILPEYADEVTDTSSATFPSSTPLARSAPIYSYSHSGPRTVQVKFTFHREMMKQINYGNNSYGVNDDYVDQLIKLVQACTVPSYSMASKMVDPPIIALRMGKDIFIKGVINGSIGLTYGLPILRNGKYAIVSFSLTITEIDPYDANTITRIGSYRSTSTNSLSDSFLSITLDRGPGTSNTNVNNTNVNNTSSSAGETFTPTPSGLETLNNISPSYLFYESSGTTPTGNSYNDFGFREHLTESTLTPNNGVINQFNNLQPKYWR